ncbi:MAG TPA: sugar ABC transporter permease [Bacillota bacterium]|nr:sugar ABC transporter permease [Bacillota bacterium]
MNLIKYQKQLLLFSFLAIPVTLLLLFVVYPFLRLLQLSFTNWDGLSTTFSYIGFDNYIKLLWNSPEVWVSLKNNWTYFWVHAIFIPIELIIAVILDSKLRATRFFKTVAFLPYIINGVAIAYVFSFFYSPEGGALNMTLQQLGLGSWIHRWLSDMKIVNYSLVTVSLWRYCGFHIILFLAGLNSIPGELFEAATVDGANSVQRLWRITIPSIKPVLEIILFLNVRGALQVFDIPFLITRGGPGYASSTFTLYTLDTAFKYNSFGLAAAMGVNLLFLIVLLSSVQKKLVNL